MIRFGKLIRSVSINEKKCLRMAKGKTNAHLFRVPMYSGRLAAVIASRVNEIVNQKAVVTETFRSMTPKITC